MVQRKGLLLAAIRPPELFVQFVNVILQLRAVGKPTSLQISPCSRATANKKRNSSGNLVLQLLGVVLRLWETALNIVACLSNN